MSERRWIPVTERLPDTEPPGGCPGIGFSRTVLVWPARDEDGSERLSGCYCFHRARWEGITIHDGGYPLRDPQPTHWMPLPDGPGTQVEEPPNA